MLHQNSLLLLSIIQVLAIIEHFNMVYFFQKKKFKIVVEKSEGPEFYICCVAHECVLFLVLHRSQEFR